MGAHIHKYTLQTHILLVVYVHKCVYVCVCAILWHMPTPTMHACIAAGMEGLLSERAPVLNGIVNGIDTDEWNPAADPHLPVKYDMTNYVEGKKACKLALQVRRCTWHRIHCA